MTKADLLDRYPRVAVVGSGLVGSSWASLFLAHGLHVRVYDPRPDVRDIVTNAIRQATPTLQALGLPVAGLEDRLTFAPTLDTAVEGAALVQESGSEDLALKQEVFARLGLLSGRALLLSSSSTLRPTDIAARMTNASRMLLGHPFNPPHLMPAVEVVAGERTEPGAVADAVAFYTAIGKRPVVLRREIQGFVANRLQAVLLGEAIHLVTQGVVTVDELDAIVTGSFGIRWAATGPFESSHINGGSGGLRHFLEHIGPPFERLWSQSGSARLDQPTLDLLHDQANHSFGARRFGELVAERDRKQLAVLSACSLQTTGTTE